MLVHPQPDPIAFAIGPVQIHWYGLMYVVAFALFLILGRVRIRQPHIAAQGWKAEDLDDMLFYGMLGVVLGGRIGYVLFYSFGEWLQNPLMLFRIWEGGMSFHGGLLGVMAGIWLWSRRQRMHFMDSMDFIAPLVPLGYAAGRIGNFINAELPGRLADPTLPWAMIWPNIDNLPRHPSPIYQALVDGVLLFIVLWLFARKARPMMAVSGVFALGYGCARFFTEYFRTPDYEVTIAGWTISAGQMLSVPMMILGIVLLLIAYRRKGR